MSYKEDKRLERKLYGVARHKAIVYTGILHNPTHNRRLIGKIAMLECGLYVKYRIESTSYYVSKKEYYEDLDKIKALEAEIEQGKQGCIEAEDTIREAKELLEMIALYRVRMKDNNRVF